MNALNDAALALLADERGVRVEDYLTALAAATGEAALVDAGWDIEGSDLVPGSALFFEPVNAVLSGDPLDLDALPPTSVLGVLAAHRERFGDVEDLYRNVAASVGGGGVEWGAVPLTVPDDNRPSLLPLRAAFELRDVAAGLPGVRHVACAEAIGAALDQVAGAIDPAIAVRLALEVVWGTAKVVPMSRRAFAEAAGDPQPGAVTDE